MNFSKKRILLILLLISVILVAGYGLKEYRTFMTIPSTRLAVGGFYKEMPPDDHHIYIRLPIDHFNPGLGTFTDFYLLSPDFKPGNKVIFQVYDNQQEMVGMIGDSSDFEIFDNRVGKGMSYVLIGNRGVSPTLFPEVFNTDDTPNYPLALKLYGSDEQIEDIESVRKDMMKRGLLPEDGKIMLYGGSGGGVLIQQYLDKYGQNVSRVLIESTGAIDLAHENNLKFARSFYDVNPQAATLLFQQSQKRKINATLAWMLFKIGIAGNPELQTAILQGRNSLFDLSWKLLYFKNWCKLSQNYALVNLMMSFPQELEIKVRIWEVTGIDLVNYNPGSEKDINLLYESLKYLLADFIEAYKKGEITTFRMDLDRSKFEGEVLVWANTGDQDFGPQIARLISDAYPHSRLKVFQENAHHIMEKDSSQLGFTKTFFETGLFSDETSKYLDLR
jgi:pimeloyl-ACP methyl ester carboxylesterase